MTSPLSLSNTHRSLLDGDDNDMGKSKRTIEHRSEHWRRKRRQATHKASHVRHKVSPTMDNITKEQLVASAIPVMRRIARLFGCQEDSINLQSVTRAANKTIRKQRMRTKRIANAYEEYGTEAVTIKPNGNMVIDVQQARRHKELLEEQARKREALRQKEEENRALRAILDKMDKEEAEKQAFHDLATDTAVSAEEETLHAIDEADKARADAQQARAFSSVAWDNGRDNAGRGRQKQTVSRNDDSVPIITSGGFGSGMPMSHNNGGRKQSNDNQHSGGGVSKRRQSNVSGTGTNNKGNKSKSQKQSQRGGNSLSFGRSGMGMGQGQSMSGGHNGQAGGRQHGGGVSNRGKRQGLNGAKGNKLANSLKGASKASGKATATSKRTEVLRKRMDMLRKRITMARKSKNERLVKALEGQIATIQKQMQAMTKSANKGNKQASHGMKKTAKK